MAASIYFSDVSMRTSGYAVEVKVPCTHSVHICGFQRGKQDCHHNNPNYCARFVDLIGSLNPKKGEP